MRGKQTKNVKDTIGALMDGKATVKYDDRAKLSALDEASQSVYTAEDVINVPEPHNVFLTAKKDKLISKESLMHEIIFYIKKLNPKKSTGPDDLST